MNAGLVVVLDDEVGNGIYFAQNRFGGVLAPTECNDVRRGIQTLALRMECQQRNAQAVAEYLLAHPLVRAVHYPGVYGDRNRLLAENGLKGFGGVLSFGLHADHDTYNRFVSHLKVITSAVSLGHDESLIVFLGENDERQYLYPEEFHGGFFRFSVGIEDTEDIIADLEQAFAKEGLL